LDLRHPFRPLGHQPTPGAHWATWPHECNRYTVEDIAVDAVEWLSLAAQVVETLRVVAVLVSLAAHLDTVTRNA
jgi:hypothetical protein